MKNIVRVMPPESRLGDSGVMLTRGTKFVLPNGSEIGGVTHCEIQLGVNDIYRCRLELIGQSPEICAELTQLVFKRPPLWQRIVEWIVGPQVREVTNMTTRECREFELSKNSYAPTL